MELPENERHELDEIERRLAEDDPKLAARLTNSAPAIFIPRRTLIAIGVLAAYLAGLITIIAGVTVASIALVLLGAVITVGVFTALTVHAWRHRPK